MNLPTFCGAMGFTTKFLLLIANTISTMYPSLSCDREFPGSINPAPKKTPRREASASSGRL